MTDKQTDRTFLFYIDQQHLGIETGGGQEVGCCSLVAVQDHADDDDYDDDDDDHADDDDYNDDD